jgi:hypothetical protein
VAGPLKSARDALAWLTTSQQLLQLFDLPGGLVVDNKGLAVADRVVKFPHSVGNRSGCPLLAMRGDHYPIAEPACYVRFGSLADILISPRHLRFYPDSGRWVAHSRHTWQSVYELRRALPTLCPLTSVEPIRRMGRQCDLGVRDHHSPARLLVWR